MNNDSEEIRIRGKTIQVPAISIRGRKVIAKGKWLKMAAVKDEEEVQGETVDGLRKAFQDSVDVYLEFCAERGEDPEKPYSGGKPEP